GALLGRVRWLPAGVRSQGGDRRDPGAAHDGLWRGRRRSAVPAGSPVCDRTPGDRTGERRAASAPRDPCPMTVGGRGGVRTISSDDLVALGLPPARPVAELVVSLPRHEVQGDRSVNEGDVVYRATAAGPGSLFLCVPGSARDGHDFAAE